MKLLYIGDIMGEVGVQTVERVLPKLIKDKSIDLVIAQAENVTEGRGISLADYQKLRKIGADFFTGGNWSNHLEEIWPALKNKHEPIVAPANYPTDSYGPGYKYVKKGSKTVLVISLLGSVVGKDSNKPMLNPFKIIDKILESEKDTSKDAIVVNFHGDFSSEKIVIGHYLDGRASLVVGDHWHVPTADARILPKGTAHQTDVGMCGILDGSLGVSLSSVIPRFRDNTPTRNVLETKGPRQFNALLVETENDHSSKSVEILNMLINENG